MIFSSACSENNTTDKSKISTPTELNNSDNQQNETQLAEQDAAQESSIKTSAELKLNPSQQKQLSAEEKALLETDNNQSNSSQPEENLELESSLGPEISPEPTKSPEQAISPEEKIKLQLEELEAKLENSATDNAALQQHMDELLKKIEENQRLINEFEQQPIKD